MKCIILAGGSGKRLWPVSRELYPKPFLNLFGEKTLIQSVYETALSLTSGKNIVTVTNIRQYDDTMTLLKKIYKNPVIISEPMSKDTAPAVICALTYLQNKKDDIVLILPVDFSVDDLASFKTSVENAKSIAQKGYIVSFCVKPEYPESGFGYIQTGEKILDGKKVKKFIEKPDNKDASDFIKQKDFYWNTGIYMAKISVLTEACKKYAPKEYLNFSKKMFDDKNNVKYEFYENLPELSIDYAIMEKTDNMAVSELETKWSDYGSWQALYNNSKKDIKNNAVKGNVILENVKESFVSSSKELVAVSGVNNMIIVETEDAILVCDKSKTSEIHKLVNKLKETNSPAALIHKTVFRPWGFYTTLNKGRGWITRIITVFPGHNLSAHYHNYRSEHWVVLEGCASVVLGKSKHILNKRQSIDIPASAKHLLQNCSNEPLKILEVQKGEYIGEDDTILIEK